MEKIYEEKETPITATNTSALHGKRIMVCGKGGSGKSTIITLLANTLSSKNNNVIVMDSDASNPGGLARLLFGMKEGVKPLIEFFGGRQKVECPVDDPSILTRVNDDVPITEKMIELSEIPNEYYVQNNGVTLFQVGKINQPLEGCDGPMSKVTRDFIVKGNAITLIDVEAGIEHYGRGIEKNVDVVIIVVDPTFESILIAQKVAILCQGMGINNYGAIINKIASDKIKTHLEAELVDRGINIYGCLDHHTDLFDAGLRGSMVKGITLKEETDKIINNLVIDLL